MGGMIETDKMLAHVESCAVCQAAGTKYMDRCDDWSDMYNNFIDWQCAEGPFENEDGEGLMMCPRCDGPVNADNYCRACQRTMICDCPSDQACDICDPYGMWRRERADIRHTDLMDGTAHICQYDHVTSLCNVCGESGL